jgi:hypothetical protein
VFFVERQRVSYNRFRIIRITKLSHIIKMIAALSIAVTITAFIFLLCCDSVVSAVINVSYNVTFLELLQLPLLLAQLYGNIMLIKYCTGLFSRIKFDSNFCRRQVYHISKIDLG